MPELPDLEIYKTNIFRKLTSKRLTGLEVFNANKVHAPKSIMVDALAGRDLLSINRIGKELFFDFGGSKVITAHLMLNGEISIIAKEAVGAIDFKILSMDFERETLVFSDRGSLCNIKYMPPPNKTPDAFDDSFTFEYFLKTSRGKSRVNIKAFLIDQSVVKGIGNAYADEILWAAKISPHSLAGKIPEEKLKELYHAINTVLKDAIDSIKRISPDIISGEERSFLKVHNRTIKKTASGYPIIIEKIASKTTYYTQEQIAYL